MKKEIIRSGLILAFTLLTAAAYMVASDQSAKSTSAKWQVATIMAAKAYPLPAGDTGPAVRYDVTVRVGNTEYVVQYVPPDGTFKESVEYQLGVDSLVLIGGDIMKYHDSLGNTREVPIISRRAIATKELDK